MKKAIVITAIMLAAGLAHAQQRSKPKAGPVSKKKSTYGAKAKRRSGPEPGRKFNFSFGLSLATSNTVKTNLSDASGTATITRSATAAGFFVYPKYNVYSGEKFSISVGIPLTFAFSGSASANSRTGVDESSSSFLYDLPLMIDYNGGVMSPQNRNGDGRIGYYAGVGIGIENTDASSFEYISTGYNSGYTAYTKAKSVGPNVHAGFVFRVGNPDRRAYFFGLRLSYKIGMNSDKFNYFTPSIFMNI